MLGCDAFLVAHTPGHSSQRRWKRMTYGTVRHALRKSQSVRTTKVEHGRARVLWALVAREVSNDTVSVMLLQRLDVSSRYSRTPEGRCVRFHFCAHAAFHVSTTTNCPGERSRNSNYQHSNHSISGKLALDAFDRCHAVSDMRLP